MSDKVGINADNISFIVRLKKSLYEDFRDAALARGATRVGIIRILITEFLKKEKKKKTDLLG